MGSEGLLCGGCEVLGLEKLIHGLFLTSFRKLALRWDGETAASWEFPGVYGLMERKDLNVEFDCENAGRSFRRSETRLSAGLTPFHLPCPNLDLSDEPRHVPSIRRWTGR